jgi:hypothetical protein
VFTTGANTLATKRKSRDTAGRLPLLLDPDQTGWELGIGPTAVGELEKAGLLVRVPVGTLRVVRYRREDVLAIARANSPESSDVVEGDAETAT